MCKGMLDLFSTAEVEVRESCWWGWRSTVCVRVCVCGGGLHAHVCVCRCVCVCVCVCVCACACALRCMNAHVCVTKRKTEIKRDRQTGTEIERAGKKLARQRINQVCTLHPTPTHLHYDCLLSTISFTENCLTKTVRQFM